MFAVISFTSPNVIPNKDRVELKGEEEEEHCDYQEDQTEHKKD